MAVLVLALTAALVDTETARTAYARAERSGSARLVASTGAGAEAPGATPPSAAPVLRTLPYVAGVGPSGRGVVQLVLGSAAVGRNVLHLAVTDRAGKPTDPAELTVTAGLSKPAIGPVPLRLVKSGSGHYIALPTFPMAGRWKLNVVVRTSEVDQVTVSTAVEIR